MTQFAVTDLWNYHNNQYQPALIERSFSGGSAHIIIHRWL